MARTVPEYRIHEFLEKRNPYCICVFVINEGEKLLRQLEEMRGICRGLADVVVADGGSTDGSTDHNKLKSLEVNTLLVKQDTGRLGTQMRMAFDWALKRGYEGVIVVDGNGKDGMEAIPRFVDELKKGVDHVQGSRFIKGGFHKNTPKSRLWGLKLLHVPLMRLASGFRYTDTTNGFRAYSARLLSSEKLAVFRGCFSGYELHYYLAVEAARQGFKCSEIPVSRVYPESGKIPTKISGLKGNFNVILKLFLACLHVYSPLKPLCGYLRNYLVALLSLAFAVTAFFSLYYNSFSVVPADKFGKWDISSEGLVIKHKIDPETRHQGKWYSLYPMYNHYIGGQGIAGSYLMHLCESKPIETKVKCLHVITAVLAVLTLMYLCYWFGTELSILSAAAFAYCAIFSPTIVISATNLYWVLWTMYLPLALGLYLLRRNEQYELNRICREKERSWIIPYSIAVFVTLFIRFTCCFEYTSSMMILAELPLIYYAVKNAWTPKKYLVNALMTGVAALLSFLTAFFCYFMQIFFYCAEMSFSKTITLTTNSLKTRTGLGAERLPDVYINSFLPELNYLFKAYLVRFTTVLNLTIYDFLSWFMWFFFITSVVLLFFRKRKIPYIRTHIAISLLCFLSTLIQFAWIVTAKGHSSIHQFLNFTLWNIPLLVISAAIGFYAFLLLIAAFRGLKTVFRNRYAFITSLLIAGALCVASFMVYKSNYSGYELLMKRLAIRGRNVPDSDVQYAFLLNKIIIKVPEADKNHPFLFHVFPVRDCDLAPNRKSVGYNNYDFYSWSKGFAVPKPTFSKSPYIILQKVLPAYPYSEIRIGQYEKGGKVIWKTVIKNNIPVRRQYSSAKITDRNWDNGIHRKNRKCLLFEADAMICTGDEVTLSTREKVTVVRQELRRPHLYVHVDKDVKDHDPAKPFIFIKTKK